MNALCSALIAIIVVGTGYGLVADDPGRKVVMSTAEFERVIEQARIDAAREAFAAAQADRECFMDWGTKPKAKGLM